MSRPVCLEVTLGKETISKRDEHMNDVTECDASLPLRPAAVRAAPRPLRGPSGLFGASAFTRRAAARVASR